MTYEIACGAVVYTRTDGGIRYVLVQQKKGFYGFPKGHVEGRETETETALREIWEEVGLRPALIDGFRAEDEYPLPEKGDVMKKVVFFLAEYEDQEIRPQEEELLGARLASYDEAMALVGYESTRQVLKKAHEFLLRPKS